MPKLLADDIANRPALAAWRRELSPRLSYGRHDGPAPVDVRAAAVAVLLCAGASGWRIPLTVRSQTLQRHGGQVSVPGGLIESGASEIPASIGGKKFTLRAELSPRQRAILLDGGLLNYTRKKSS